MNGSNFVFPVLILVAGAAWLIIERNKKGKSNMTGPAVVLAVGAIWTAKAAFDASSAVAQDAAPADYTLPPRPLDIVVAGNQPPALPPVVLTQEEATVKDLADQGLDAIAIAQQLGITPQDALGILGSIDLKETQVAEQAMQAAAAAEAQARLREAQLAEAEQMRAASEAANAARVAAARTAQTATFGKLPDMDGTARENRDAALAFVQKITPQGMELRTPFTFGLGADSNFWRQPSSNTPQDAVFEVFGDWLRSGRPDRVTLATRYFDFLSKSKSGSVVRVNGEDVTRIYNLIASTKG